jgi:V/A-type H+-transporting ATPase subunit B
VSLTYKRIDRIVGPLIFLNNPHLVQNEEMVTITDPTGETRLGRVLESADEVVTIEVFAGTQGLAHEGVKVEFTQSTFKIGVSTDMLGRTFNGLGKPIDYYEETGEPKPPIIPEMELDVNGAPINPWARVYPHNVIQTGISAIDGLNSLVRGQKLPIFTGYGLPHNQLAAQIVRQARVTTNEPFVVIFVGIGILQDEAIFFQNSFREAGNFQNVLSFLNLASDPAIERILVPRIALTVAEYLAFEKDMHVLVVMTDITNYAEAVRELSSAKGEVPSRKGFPGYLYSDFASIYERAGQIKGKKGSITQVPIISMPNDDISHPIPDLTGYITEGQLVLTRNLNKRNIYPPFEILSSLSRLMKEGIGEGLTRDDHADVSSQLYAFYSEAMDVRELESIIGTESLTPTDQNLLQFATDFEQKFLNQDSEENRSIGETLDLAWTFFRKFPRAQLIRISEKMLDKYYNAVPENQESKQES